MAAPISCSKWGSTKPFLCLRKGGINRSDGVGSQNLEGVLAFRSCAARGRLTGRGAFRRAVGWAIGRGQSPTTQHSQTNRRRFEVLEQIADFFDAHTELGRRHRFLKILEEFRITIQQELNYEREAQNLIALGENLKEFELIQVPQPVPDYSTRSVLTMDYVQGRKITSVGPLGRLDMNGAPLAEELFKAYLKQVLVDGLFHADPHPGNVFLTDNGRIALLDLGMVGHTTPGMQENLLKLLLAISEGNSDEAAGLVIRISQTTEEFNQTEFRRRIGQLMAARQDQGLQ